MILPGIDGVDHINIYSQGKTELGRALSNFSTIPFIHPVHGRFETVEGFWYWLTTRDDRLRTLPGWQCKKLGRSLQRLFNTKFIEGCFRKEIQIALEEKAKNPKIFALLRSSTLPFCHYYVFDGAKKDAHYEWIVEMWENIRTTLKGE